MSVLSQEDSLPAATITSDTLLTLKPFYGTLPMNHPDALAPYPCLHCRRRCFTIHDLDLHARWHRRENECSLCHKTFASFEIFAGHVRKHYVDATKDYAVNNQIRDIPATCRYCEEKFSTVRDMNSHFMLYADSYRECERCEQFLPACHRHWDKAEDMNDEIAFATPTGEDTCPTHMASVSEAVVRKEVEVEEKRGTEAEPNTGGTAGDKTKPGHQKETFKKESVKSRNLVNVTAECKSLKISPEIKKFSYELRRQPILRPYHCTVCLLRFSDKDSLIRHLNQHYTEHKLLFQDNQFPNIYKLQLRDSYSKADSHSYGLHF